MKEEIVGILPCGGAASRLGGFRYPKQLLPILYTKPDNTGNSMPILAAEYSLLAMKKAGIKKCIITTNDWRYELLKYFGNGKSVGVQIAYVSQELPKSMPEALTISYPWIRDSLVALAWPDTYFEPFDSMRVICQEIRKTNADVVLAVFPNIKPEQSFPVHYNEEGIVISKLFSHKKCAEPNNTCGLAVWNSRFTEFIKTCVDEYTSPEEQQIMDIFDIAVKRDMHVRAVPFKEGKYTDLGVASGIGEHIINYGETQI